MDNQIFIKFLKCEDGSPAMEYSMIAAVIGVILIAAFGGLGKAIVTLFTGSEGSIGAAIDGALGS